MAVARVLRAAERQVDLGARRTGVHVGDPRGEVANRAEGLVHVPREDRGREAVLDAVADPDCLVERVHGDECGRRPEDLLLRDAHVGADVAEDGRPVVEALVEAVALAISPPVSRSAPSPRPISVYEWIFSKRRAIDHRPDVRLVLPPHAELQLLDVLDEPRLQRLNTPCCTITRLAAVQRCPEVPKADQMIPSTARSRSASSRTMIAFCPRARDGRA